MPTLSRTTVYNVLSSLVDAGLTRTVFAQSGEQRYDASVEDHGHFKCTCCGKLYDFEVEVPPVSESLPGFEVTHTDLFLTGICPECKEK